MTPFHPYRPVDSTGAEIRRLALHPSSNLEAPLVAFLESVNLNASPSFEALSYTWGDVGTPCTVTLDGQPFEVRENAAAALRRLRLPRAVRYLWIDALCINQRDVAERSGQVMLMQRIYGQATRVCIFLGELGNGGPVGMRLLQNKMLAVGWHSWRKQRTHDKGLMPMGLEMGGLSALKNRSDHVNEQMNGEVRELLDRPWWTRTWIIQEAVLARELVVMCGGETVTWESFAELWSRLKWTQGRVQVFNVPINEKDLFPDEVYKIISDYRKSWHDSSPESVSIFDVLYRFRGLECSDERDKIYGFVGIVPSMTTMGVRADYTSPATQVYRNFAYNIIRSSRCLDVLNCKREWEGVQSKPKQAFAYSLLDQGRYYDLNAVVSDDSKKKTRKAWVRLPDGWERIPQGSNSVFKNHLDNQVYPTSPLAGLPPQKYEYHTKQRILPAGWKKRWDCGGRAKIAFEPYETKEDMERRLKKERVRETLRTGIPSWVPNWATPTDWDPAPLLDWTLPQQQFWASGDTLPCVYSDDHSPWLSLDGLYFDTIDCIAAPLHPETERPPLSRKGIDVLMAWEALGSVEVDYCPYKSHPGGRKNALWRTMIADHAGAGAVPDEDEAYVETWYDRTGWLSNIPDFAKLGIWDSASEENKLLSIEAQMVEAYYNIKPMEYQGFRDALKQSVREPFKIQERYGVYLRRIHRACAHRALMVTRRGYIGLAPWNAKEGDGIAILYGGKTPFLVRPEQDTGRVKLVGESYVYGLMAGEALMSADAQQIGTQILHIS